MSKEIRVFLIIGILFSGLNGFSQRIGLLPPDVKWHQLKNDSLRIIFPDGQEATARRVASLMLKVAALDPITTTGRHSPISVILQPQTNISNGYVGLAPYVSEFYLQANEDPFSLGSLEWSDLLALHEYRHVMQVNAANKGFSHVAKVVFGELAFTGLYNLAVPDWFREGDAVYSETKWSLQGRGRLSKFTLPFRQKVMMGEPWNYYKVRNGSYREYTPDQYSMGYLMVQYGNYIFGEETWDTIMQEAATFKHLFRPFSEAVKERTGKRNKFLYLEAMNWYRDIWNTTKVNDITYTPITLKTKDLENVYFDMSYPDVSGDGNIYTSITTFDRTTAIYQISPAGDRKKVTSMGLQQENYFDHSGHRLVWTELRFDPRWLRKDQNVIVVYNEETGKKMDIKPVKGYFTPSLDHRGSRIVALHVDSDGHYNLHIIDARTGGVLAMLPNDENLYLGYPVWSSDEQSIIATARNEEGSMSLVEQQIATGEIRHITHTTYSVMGKPYIHGDWIFLSTSLDVLDQVYAVDKSEGIFYQVTGGNTAHYDPVWDPVQDDIVCSEYHINGKKIVRASGQIDKWKLYNLHDGIKPCEGVMCINLLSANIDSRSFNIRKYSPWSNAINIHSWTVKADDPVWGVEVRSDNIMNNILLRGGYEYNRNSKAAGPYAELMLGMYYPVMTFGISQTSREVLSSDGREFNVSNESVNAGLSLPLFYSSGVFQQTILLSSTYNKGLSKIRPRVSTLEDFGFNYLSHRFVVINSRLKSYRQPMPTWGQRADIIYSHEITGVPLSQFYASGELALPAVKASHYTLVHGEYMSQDISEGSIQLGSSFRGSRGFQEVDGKIQYGGGITYGFPIWYPDMGIGNIFYTKRVRLQAFFDMSYTNDEAVTSPWMRSTGVEAIIDFEFPPISFGIRYSRLLSGFDGSPDQLEVFLPELRF